MITVTLGMLSTKLKELANELDVFILSGTQLNGQWVHTAKTGIRNQNLIRGSKAVADKIDVGMITLPVLEEELITLSKIIQQHGSIRPTHVTDIYKVRRGRFCNVRLWRHIDLGTARIRDLFLTDAQFNTINVNKLVYKIEGFKND